MDCLLSQVPDPKELPEPYATCNPRYSTVGPFSRFAVKDDSDVKDAQQIAIPGITRKQTNWNLDVWKKWSEHHRKLNVYDCPSHLPLFILAKLIGLLVVPV